MGIMFARMYLDLILRIARYKPDGIPGDPRTPQFNYDTITPAGTTCYFFMTAHERQSFTYGLVEDVVAGLKIFLVDQKRYEQFVFEVESQGQLKAFGGFSIAITLLLAAFDPREKTSTDLPFFHSTSTDLTTLLNLKLDLTCTFGDPLPPSSIAQVLGIARIKAMTHINHGDAHGLLPTSAESPAGEYSVDGNLGAELRISGIEPAHMTWEMMQAAVQGLRIILVGDKRGVEAHCTMTYPGKKDIVGVILVKKGGDEGGVAQQ
ncbi:MAG: hypothetical protein Q9218_006627 [Villophora microphyllina]